MILLKPNLLVPRDPARAVTTHPSVFRAVARRFVTAGARVTYGDSPGFGGPAFVSRRTGIASIAEDLGVDLADFTNGRTVPFPEGRLIKRFTIAEGVAAADGIISLPKLKTHGLTRITGAIKNQYGCIPGALKAEFHARLPNADLFSRMLVDLNRLLAPRLFIMDGIVAMEGNGPQNGSPRPMNVLLLSADPVALDATVCELVGLDPSLVLPIVYGAEAGLGRASDIECVGDPIESFAAGDFDVNRRSASTTGGPGRYSRLARRFVVPRPVIRTSQCTTCGTCVAVCPVTPKAVDFVGSDRSRTPVHRYDRCIRCYCCQEMCPEGAIVLRVPLLGRAIHHRPRRP
jgi:uncharacterized protein (DUF362 family)/Pyruvate/2-oxoacid:ferredoxin oxidoreductase delta subunit